jgi:hypothetical protein
LLCEIVYDSSKYKQRGIELSFCGLSLGLKVRFPQMLMGSASTQPIQIRAESFNVQTKAQQMRPRKRLGNTDGTG